MSEVKFPAEKMSPFTEGYSPSFVSSRNDILSGWLHSVREEHGVDDESESYAETIMRYADELETNLPPLMAYHWLNELSEICETQLDLAEKIEEKAQPEEGLLESVLTYGADIQDQGEMIDFLRQPVRKDTLEKFISKNKIENPKEFHESFWLLSNEERAEFLSDVLDTSQDELVFKAKAITQFEELFNAFLPPEKEGSNARAYGVNFTKAVASSVDNKDLVFLLSSALKAVYDDAREPKSDDPDVRFGYRMASFAMAIGGAKIAQNAHSLSKTPEVWKQGLAQVKSKASPMRRLAFLKQAQSFGNQSIYSCIKRIGARRGAGTYIDTKIVEMTDSYLATQPQMATEQNEKDGLVLQFLKEGSSGQSKRIFDLTIKAIKKIGETDKKAQEAIGKLIPMIEHAVNMIDEETNLQHSGAKGKLAKKLINGLVVKVHNLTTEFFAAGAFAFGKNFKISRNVEGEHFNDFPEKTVEQREIKAKVAESIFTASLYTMLTGRQFNHDAHGDNNRNKVKVWENDHITIQSGHFDDGAIMLNAPTDQQKRMMANIVMDSLANSAINGFGQPSSLFHTIERVRDYTAQDEKASLDDLAYIDAMSKAVPALMDYTKYMSLSAIGRSVNAVLKTRDIDPAIMETIKGRYKDINFLSPRFSATAEKERRNNFYPKPEHMGSLAQNWLKFRGGIPNTIVLKVAPYLIRSNIFGQNSITKPDRYNQRFG